MEPIRADLNERIVLLMGPRQSGKTTLSKSLGYEYEYFNFDRSEHRLRLKEKSWDRDKALVIFDELHKMKKWKAWIKGVYDTERIPPRLLVTGSARLDTYRKVGDSLAGRYFRYRLHPVDIKEVRSEIAPQEAFLRLMRVGGFPEPFLRGEERFYKRWRQSHLDIILRQDLIELENVRDITAIETLVELLRDRVGSPVSFSSLGRDLERDPKTIKRWVTILENLYVIFRVTPFHRNVARSLLKEPKIYFFDNAAVRGNEGIKLENLVACALRKELDRVTDTEGDKLSLCYLRNKDGQEVDFLVVRESRPERMLEIKWAESGLSPGLKHFSKFLPHVKKLQLVQELSHEKTFPGGFEMRRLVPWLATMDFSNHVG